MVCLCISNVGEAMALIIRDDDLSFWSTPEEIEDLYGPLFRRGIKVSFATIPFAVRMHNAGDFERFCQEEDPRPLGENKELVAYLRSGVRKGLIEIMLHGYDHLYRVEASAGSMAATCENLSVLRNRGEHLRFIGEFAGGTVDELTEKIRSGRSYLEGLLDTKITNFVPPSNQISYDGIRALIRNGMNLSGLIGRKYDREWSLRGLMTFTDRILFSLSHSSLTYPKIADYGRHRELAGYALTPTTDRQRYEEQLAFCMKKGYPFQIATHYWELGGELREYFYQLVETALTQGMRSKHLNEVL